MHAPIIRFNRTYLTAQNQQSHGDADDTAQPPLRITVPAIKHRSPNYAALQTLNPSMPPNTRRKYRPLRK